MAEAKKTRPTPSDDQKAAYVEVAVRHGRKVAAQHAKVGVGTITTWAKSLGVKLPKGGRGKQAGKGKTRRAQQPAATAPNPVKKPPLGAQIRETMRSLEAMHTALREVFGPMLDGG